MPEAVGEQPKKVPKRVDVKPQGLIKNTGEVDLFGKDPDYVYQAFSQNPESPGYLEKYTHEHLYGEGQPYCQWIGPWQVVNSQTDRTQASQATTAQGTPVDTRQRGPGTQIIARIHKSEYAKYIETDRANSEERAKELGNPDRQHGQLSSITTTLREGAEIDPARALMEAGHPMPGMRQA
jgi:hypothetical protein